MMKIDKNIVDYIVSQGYEWQKQMVEFIKDAIAKGHLIPWE